MSYDIVIPVADEQVNPYLDIAIDSILRYVPEARITLAGAVHSPVHTGVHNVIRVEQAAGGGARRGIANTDRIMAAVCESRAVGERFVWSNDDIFWRRHTSAAEIVDEGQKARGELRILSARVGGIHSQLGRAAADILEGHGLPTWDFERHVPLVVESELMLGVLSWPARYGTAHKRSLYGNLVHARRYPGFGTPPSPTIEKDVKVWKENETWPDSPFVSVGPHFPAERVRTTLQL